MLLRRRGREANAVPDEEEMGRGPSNQVPDAELDDALGSMDLRQLGCRRGSL